MGWKGPDSYCARPRCQAVGIAFPFSWWAPTNITPFRASESSSAFCTTPHRAQSVLKWFSKVYYDLQCTSWIRNIYSHIYHTYIIYIRSIFIWHQHAGTGCHWAIDWNKVEAKSQSQPHQMCWPPRQQGRSLMPHLLRTLYSWTPTADGRFWKASIYRQVQLVEVIPNLPDIHN